MSNQITEEKYVALTTYKKDGSTGSTPVWIVPLDDGKVGFTTSSSSLKVTRIRNNPQVHLQPSDSRGRVKDGSTQVDGTATIVSGPEFEQVWGKVLDKYGIQARAINLLGKLAKLRNKGSGTDTAIIITLN